jgi:guanylate kinase
MSIVYIISAPSGSGKSSIVAGILRLVPNLEFSISYTTRQPRGSEKDGREYFFVSVPEFEKMIRNNEFLEYATVFGDGGDYYGTARRFLIEAEQHGRDLLLDIDVQGAEQVKRRLPAAVSIFVLPPDRATLERRLRNRGSDSEAKICRRLVTASGEIENYEKYDYILVNDRLEESIDDLKAIVLARRLASSGKPLSEADNGVLQAADRFRLENTRDRVKPIVASFMSQAQPCGRNEFGGDNQ